MNPRVLQKHDRFSILNRPGIYASERLVDRNLQHLNILALGHIATTRIDAALRVVLRDKEVEPLSDRPRAHKRLKDALHARDDKPGFLLHLGLDSLLRACL